MTTRAGTARHRHTPDRPVSARASEPLDRLREQIAECTTEPYLLSVTQSNRPHCGSARPGWDVANLRLTVDAPSSWPGSAASGYCQVSLVWPPAQLGGYSLIVDGTAAEYEPARLAIAPTRAVLYRPGPAQTSDGSSCGSDCIPILS